MLSYASCHASEVSVASVAFIVNDYFQSVRHSTNKILKSCHRNWSPGFAKSHSSACFQYLWLLISTDCCGHNAPNVFNNWRQIWRIRGQSSGGIYCPMFLSSQVIVALDVCARAPSCWNNPSQLRENSFVAVKSLLIFVRLNADLTSFSSISLM